jgi:TIGR03009 family protein
MFRSKRYFLLAITVACAGIAAPFSSQVIAQSNPAPAGEGNPQDQVHPVMWQILAAWEKSSSQIKKLKGEHLRRVYDHSFQVETLAEGRFYYEAPDKGRIDVEPVQITPQMLQQREQGQIPAKKNSAGQLYKLQAGETEQWICDGLKVYEINVDKKEARVFQLPPQLQGKNIMNSPLPFLFGLPPEEAVNRFELTFRTDPRTGQQQVYQRGDQFAYIHAVPKLRQDQANWKSADIILDVKEFLPAHIRLVDPAGTKEDVYSFSGLKKNSVFQLPWDNPFNPNLRGYSVKVMEPGQGDGLPADNPQMQQPQIPVAQGNRNPQSAVMPDLIGKSHVDASAALKAMGINAAQIKMVRGGPAPEASREFHVRNQIPKAGTPVTPNTSVALQVWESVARQ